MIKKDNVITIIGGSGFLGSYITRELAPTGARINIISRNASKHIDLKINGYVGQISLLDIDINNSDAIEKIIQKSDYVINLVGILYETKYQKFKNIHATFPKNIASLCKKHNVKKFIHMSALGVDKANMTSKYAESKLLGEKNAIHAFSKTIILRPSVVFGAEDNFSNLFNSISKISPFLPLIGGGETLFQPVYVKDIACAISKILSSNTKFNNNVVELGGPEQMSFKQVLQSILKISGRKRVLIPIPFCIAKIKAFFLELFPKPLMTRDQIELLKYDNIVFNDNGFAKLGIKPHRFDFIARTYIK